MTESPNATSTPGVDAPTATTVNVLEQAPVADPNRSSPVAQRLVQADGANVIVFSFAPAQSMPEHQAAHPIIVQCLSGYLDFTAEGETVSMVPGVVIHLAARVPHDVVCPVNASENSVLMLTMLTGETVSS